MRFIIFGAGETGHKAYNFLGPIRTEYFIDNRKAGTTYLGVQVISLQDAMELQGEYIYVVASQKYEKELESQLLDNGINNYFVFKEDDLLGICNVLPRYLIYGKYHHMNYDEILANYHMIAYKKIVVYGLNEYLPYLLTEIAYQSRWENIMAVIDENAKTNNIMGIPVERSLEKIYQNSDCIVINKRRTESDIRNKLPKGKMIIDVYDIDKFISGYLHPELASFKDAHKGERAFIIGNGPSLKVTDLDTLYEHNEICFGANMIWKIYNDTKWRATYLLLSDKDSIMCCKHKIPDLKEKIFVWDTFHSDVTPIFENVTYLHRVAEEYYPNMPGFSEDITRGTYAGYTITYDIALQLAAYMGFTEIYLLGMDNCFTSEEITDSRNHFIKDYYSESDKQIYAKRKDNNNWYLINKAYESAEWYSREHGFRIYNATRGGKLEVFERVDFDSLFDD